MAINAGTAVVNVVGEYKDKITYRSKKALETFKKNAERAFKAAAVALAAFVTAFAAFSRSQAKAIEDINKMSVRLGISTEALSQYRLVVSEASLSFDALVITLQRMTRRVSEAAGGTGEAVNALRELNLSATELNLLPVDQQFERIAEALYQVDNQGRRVLLAFKLFDTEGVGLLQAMEGGADGIRKLRLEADRMGLTLTQFSAKRISDINKKFRELKLVVGALAEKTLVRMSDELVALAEWIADSALPVFNAANKAWTVTTNLMSKLSAFALIAAGAIANMSGEVEEANLMFGAANELLEKVKKREEEHEAVVMKLEKRIARRNRTQEISNALADQYLEDLEFEIQMTNLKVKGKEKLIPLLIAEKALEEIIGKNLTREDRLFVVLEEKIDAQQQLNEQLKLQNEIVAIGERLFDNFGNGIMRNIQDGIGVFQSFRNAAVAALFDIQREIIRLLVFEPFKKSAAGFIGNIFGLSGFPGPGMVPGNALGGGLAGGMPSVVGERGPELFVPDRSGSIIPNNKLNRIGGEIHIHQHIGVGTAQTVRAEMMSMMPIFLEQAKIVIADERGRSVSYSEQMGVA